MDDFLTRSFGMLVFLHILSAVIWVGGMIAIRFAVHPAMSAIEDPTIRLGRTIEALGNFFAMIKIFIWILLLSGVAVVYISYGFKNPLVHIKETIWLVMGAVFVMILLKHRKAKQAFEQNDFATAKAQLAPIASKLIPTNIVLGLFAILVGVVLRG